MPRPPCRILFKATATLRRSRVLRTCFLRSSLRCCRVICSLCRVMNSFPFRWARHVGSYAAMKGALRPCTYHCLFVREAMLLEQVSQQALTTCSGSQCCRCTTACRIDRFMSCMQGRLRTSFEQLCRFSFSRSTTSAILILEPRQTSKTACNRKFNVVTFFFTDFLIWKSILIDTNRCLVRG